MKKTVLFPITKDELYKLYIDKGLTCKEIGELYNIKKEKVLYWLKKYNIQVRSTGNIPGKEYHFEGHNKIKFDDELLTKMYLNGTPMKIMKETFRCDSGPIRNRAKELGLKRSPEVYHNMQSTAILNTSKDDLIISLYKQGKSGPEISKIVGYSSATVLKHIRRSGVINTRSLSNSQFIHNKKEYPTDLDDFEKLYDMYVTNRMSKKDIGKQYNVAPGFVNRKLKEFGINIRGNSEARKGLYIGEKHPNWKGGRTGIYMRLREYFWVNQIPDILKRDHYCCQLCGSKKKLQVHHIKSFKEIFDEILEEHKDLDVIKNEHELYEIMRNDIRLNDYNNLITYCKECHLFKIHGYNKTQN